MSIAKLAISAFAASLTLGVGIHSASASSSQSDKECVFDKYAPTAVSPYIAENNYDYGAYSYLGGAQLFVPAREGLTKEWLAASVQQALAAARAAAADGVTADCDGPNVKNVNVSVISAGNGFWVQLLTSDNQSAGALLKWARGIVAPQKLVTGR
jgi:hypothetical protein